MTRFSVLASVAIAAGFAAAARVPVIPRDRDDLVGGANWRGIQWLGRRAGSDRVATQAPPAPPAISTSKKPAPKLALAKALKPDSPASDDDDEVPEKALDKVTEEPGSEDAELEADDLLPTTSTDEELAPELADATVRTGPKAAKAKAVEAKAPKASGELAAEEALEEDEVTEEPSSEELEANGPDLSTTSTDEASAPKLVKVAKVAKVAKAARALSSIPPATSKSDPKALAAEKALDDVTEEPSSEGPELEADDLLPTGSTDEASAPELPKAKASNSPKASEELALDEVPEEPSSEELEAENDTEVVTENGQA
ncbi:hypothetical protein RSAG8_04956, partial [Rhizoctonia solani AG-8 WAC10335]